MNTLGEDTRSQLTDSTASLARYRREVLVAGHQAPQSARATRVRHLRKLAAARSYVFSLALVGGGLFLIGASTGRLVWAVVPPLLVLAVIVTLVWRKASRLAERDFFTGYALSRKMDYSERMSLFATTPLLGAGDRQRCEHYMEGELESVDRVGVGLAHFIYETREQRNDRRNRPISVYTPHAYTIAVAELPRAMTAFPGIHLVRRGGWFGGDSWLDRDGLVPVELESAELATDYELLVKRSQDRARLLQLFKPSFQLWLAGQPFQIFFEYAAGTLVVYAPKRLKDARDLDEMLRATDWIAKLILKEGEPLQMVAANSNVTALKKRAELSKAPPKGIDGFPPPPPATKPEVERSSAPALHVAPEPAPEPAYTRASIPPPTAV